MKLFLFKDQFLLKKRDVYLSFSFHCSKDNIFTNFTMAIISESLYFIVIVVDTLRANIVNKYKFHRITEQISINLLSKIYQAYAYTLAKLLVACSKMREKTIDYNRV